MNLPLFPSLCPGASRGVHRRHVDMVYESNKVGVGPSLFERERRQINANDEGGY